MLGCPDEAGDFVQHLAFVDQHGAGGNTIDYCNRPALEYVSGNIGSALVELSSKR